MTNICLRLAPMVRSKLTTSGSTDFKPSTILTTIGKKAVSATTMIFGVRPYPTQMSSSGATTMIGTICKAMTNG